MSAVLQFPRPQPTAFVERIGHAYRITLRNGAPATRGRSYTYADGDEAAERAIGLRDYGSWRLSYGPGADVVRAIVDSMSEGGAA